MLLLLMRASAGKQNDGVFRRDDARKDTTVVWTRIEKQWNRFSAIGNAHLQPKKMTSSHNSHNLTDLGG